MLALLAGALLAGCSTQSAAQTEIDRAGAWVGDYPALGEPVSSAIAVRDQGDDRIPTPDDAFDAVVVVTPETMSELTATYEDLVETDLNSFTPDWLLEELPEGGTWLHSEELDDHLEDEDGRGLIVKAYLNPDQDQVVLTLMEM